MLKYKKGKISPGKQKAFYAKLSQQKAKLQLIVVNV